MVYKRIATFVLPLIAFSAVSAADGYHMLSTQTGRFAYGWTGGTGKTAMMLDTQTGRMWEIVCMVDDVKTATADDCKYTALKPVFFQRQQGYSLTPEGPIVKPN